MLEELLKRIDGLEKRLGESENGPASGGKDLSPPLRARSESVPSGLEQQQQIHQQQQQQRLSPPASVATAHQSGAVPISHLTASMPMPMHLDQQDDPRATELVPKLIDTFFKRVNGKPYSFFHEATFRGDLAARTLPKTVVNAVCAAAIRYDALLKRHAFQFF